MSDADYHKLAHESLERFSRTQIDENYWTAFADSLHYQSNDFDNPKHFRKLDHKLNQINTNHNTKDNHIFYLSTPTNFFPMIVNKINKTKLNDPPRFAQIMIEKPFNHDLNTARDLAETMHHSFQKHQIYQIDHYLNKKT